MAGSDARAAGSGVAVEAGRPIDPAAPSSASGHIPRGPALWSWGQVRVSSDPDRGCRPASGMFQGLSSWFGLEQPAASGRQSEGDGQRAGDAPPEQRAEAVVESAEGEPQQAGDQELLHQAKGLGSESTLAPGTRECRGMPASILTLLGRGRDWLGPVGWGEGEGEEGVSVGQSSQDGRGW